MHSEGWYFSCCAALLWNQLPGDTKDAPTVASLKYRLYVNCGFLLTHETHSTFSWSNVLFLFNSSFNCFNALSLNFLVFFNLFNLKITWITYVYDFVHINKLALHGSVKFWQWACLQPMLTIDSPAKLTNRRAPLHLKSLERPSQVIFVLHPSL